MHSLWQIKSVDEAAVAGLERDLGIGTIEAKLLAARGVRSAEEAFRLLNPVLEHLHDPFLFSEMETAVSILRKAIAERERILIHGDYDADGVCGTALLYEVLGFLGADVHFFVPDRAKDGYGLARRVLERGLEVGVGLLISVDCGSSDGAILSDLADRGVKAIVTDHHEISFRPAAARAFLNPKLPGEGYPFKELTGAGVAFKLLQGLERALGIGLSLESKLDLVAIGTLADSGAMIDENRIIVKAGLEELKKWKRPGLRALRDAGGFWESSPSPRQLSFTIIPRLNSPGRMGSARDAVELLVTRDERDASEIATRIEQHNSNRRMHDSWVTDQATYLADIILRRGEPKALVFSSASWHEGVVGIGASRLAERYNMPAVLIALRDGIGKGSVRSAGKVNIKEALERCSGLLLDYGGHKEAGGFSIKEENIPEFQRLFEEVVEEIMACPDASCAKSADAQVFLSDCDMELLSFIERLGPFGPLNPEPLLMMKYLRATKDTKVVGEGHLKLVAEDGTGETRELIGFSMASTWKPENLKDKMIDVLAHLRRNLYQGRVEPQLQIHDIRFSECSLA